MNGRTERDQGYLTVVGGANARRRGPLNFLSILDQAVIGRLHEDSGNDIGRSTRDRRQPGADARGGASHGYTNYDGPETRALTAACMIVELFGG